MVYFARYDSNAIKVNRKRKRAIAKQAAKTRSKVIEVGDTVEVVGSYYDAGFENGTIAIVDKIENYGLWIDVKVKVYLPYLNYWSGRFHRISDLKKSRKGDFDMHYERTDVTTRYLLFPDRLTLHVIEHNRLKAIEDVTEDEVIALLDTNEWVKR